MKTSLSMSEVKERIGAFFGRKEFTAEEVRRVKRLAMKFKIRLGNYRRLFCKRCFAKLKGKTRVSKKYKSVVCGTCGYKNRFAISQRM
ncbi:MAG: hypothetical protein KKD18_00905 [Nanoarchaeota archaeon]|nr:hypothetical protein [Nanoarchaeota archaeon]MBU0976957.1 hypothetical protein [Nanoarchaeota archaeon]